MTPTVTFVVPCYKLAHLLKECIDSILGQSFRDFEILIMDDCSPDNTAEVAQSFDDPRVQYIRNNPNLGSLRNYNKGISLARGKYIWLISADDYLRRPYILEKYVSLLESNPGVGYTFCTGVGVLHGKETGLLKFATYGNHDRIVNGRQFLRTLIHYNLVLAASGLVRRECYEKVGMFPLERGMVWTGDWYLWCAFALHYDVGYFAEPMVCYREHELSMTSVLKRSNAEELFMGDVAVPWMIKKKAAELGLQQVVQDSLQVVAYRYALCLAPAPNQPLELSIDKQLEKFEESIQLNSNDSREKDWLRAQVYIKLGDSFYWHGDKTAARRLYLASLRFESVKLSARAKLLALTLGFFGDFLRRTARAARG